MILITGEKKKDFVADHFLNKNCLYKIVIKESRLYLGIFVNMGIPEEKQLFLENLPLIEEAVRRKVTVEIITTDKTIKDKISSDIKLFYPEDYYFKFVDKSSFVVSERDFLQIEDETGLLSVHMANLEEARRWVKSFGFFQEHCKLI